MSDDFVPPGGPAPAGPPASDPARHSAGPTDPAAPYGAAPTAEPIGRPKPVEIAFWLYLAAAVLSLLALVVSFASIDAVREQTLRQLEEQGQGDMLPPEAVEGAIWTGLVIGVVFALLFAAAYVVFAMLLRRGYGWARWVLAAFTVLAVFGVLGGGLGVLQFLTLAAATVLVFLPASNAWFRSAAERRSGRRA